MQTGCPACVWLCQAIVSVLVAALAANQSLHAAEQQSRGRFSLRPRFWSHILTVPILLTSVRAQGKAQPQQLMRVGSTLYRRALSFTVTSPKPLSVIRGIEEDGTAQLSALTAPGADQVGWKAE